MPIVRLSDGKDCEVRRLGIFELDDLPQPDIRPFTYTINTVVRDTYQATLDVSRYKTPPLRPDITTGLVEFSSDWYALREWQIYQGAMSHGSIIMIEVADYADKVLEYILTSCISRDDLNRVATTGDFENVYTAALVEQLSLKLIKETLSSTYNATYEDEEIFDALDSTSGGDGAYNALRHWENKLCIKMHMSEAEYAMLDVRERARKVCAMMLDDWMGAIEADRRSKEMR